MTKYFLVQSRIETFTRSDGKRIMLLPEPNCQLCATPIPPDKNYDFCYDCNSGKSQVDKINLSQIHAATIYVPEVTPNVLINDEILNCKNDPTYVNGLAEVLEYVIKNSYNYAN